MNSKAAHKNVVQYLGLESIESNISQRVLALELCDGLLQNLIDQAPNGLAPPVFFCVARDIINAIEHLHSLQILHRDIKPDNVMFKVSKNEKVFKLGDFGFARELQSDETYNTIYGTPEYIHPVAFAKYYHSKIGIPAPKELLSERHEWWSIGVTLYETATGELPFVPKKKARGDPKTMYTMISTKEDGVIAATECEGGQIVWMKEFPESCQIENRKVVKFLAGLLKVTNVNC